MVTQMNSQPRPEGGRPPRERAVFDAIADPTRRAILDGLASGPRPAGENAADFAVSRPAVSKPLRALETAGLVHVAKDGRRRLYQLDPRPLAEVDRWVARYRTAWAARLVNIKREAEASVQRDAPADPEGKRDDS